MACPLCGQNHLPGACPITTRARSNAITSYSDPRAPESPLQQQLRTELAKPLVIDDPLRRFLQRVFARPDLMAGPDGLADSIYGLYNEAPAAGNVPIERARQFVNLLWAEAKQDLHLTAELQNSDPTVTLQQLQVMGNDRARVAEFLRQCADFIYFTIGGQAAFRVYANVKFDSVPAFYRVLRTYWTTHPAHGISSFKIVGPALIESRSDTVVAYCTSHQAANDLAAELAKQPALLNTTAPEMTTQVGPGIGVSLGAEPKWQPTGLADKHNLVDRFTKQYSAAGHSPADAKLLGTRLGESAQSFGTIRSELIAAGIHNYNANKAVIGAGFEAFAKFVAIAFRGAGLDPAQSGN